MQTLRERFRFFLEHSGYCTPPGRAACALSSARDEARGEELGLVFEWQDDELADTSWCERCQSEDFGHQEQHRLWICEAKLDGETLAQLCGIDFGAGRDPWMRDPYKRVIEAELAGEALACIDALEHVG